MTPRYLVDKSALARWPCQQVKDVVMPLHLRGLLCVNGAVEMEILYSARNRAEAEKLRDWLGGFDWLTTPDEVWDRAQYVQREAIAHGNHRALSMPDVLIAATAERHHVTVLHYDGDFDMIAAITGQPMAWVVASGSVA